MTRLHATELDTYKQHIFRTIKTIVGVGEMVLCVKYLLQQPETQGSNAQHPIKVRWASCNAVHTGGRTGLTSQSTECWVQVRPGLM